MDRTDLSDLIGIERTRLQVLLDSDILARLSSLEDKGHIYLLGDAVSFDFLNQHSYHDLPHPLSQAQAYQSGAIAFISAHMGLQDTVGFIPTTFSTRSALRELGLARAEGPYDLFDNYRNRPRSYLYRVREMGVELPRGNYRSWPSAARALIQRTLVGRQGTVYVLGETWWGQADVDWPEIDFDRQSFPYAMSPDRFVEWALRDPDVVGLIPLTGPAERRLEGALPYGLATYDAKATGWRQGTERMPIKLYVK
jgi:hypothetical protein